MNRQQRYKIVLLRTEKGNWELTSYWEHPPDFPSTSNKSYWDLDGAPLYFNTRAEAQAHLAKATGVPE